MARLAGLTCCDNALQIIVQWEAVAGTATADDYSPTRGVVILSDGAQSAPVPISIVDETVPEFSEQFTLRLVGVVGGGRLGGVTSATVTIAASDNPNGALRKSGMEIKVIVFGMGMKFFLMLMCRVCS